MMERPSEHLNIWSNQFVPAAEHRLATLALYTPAEPRGGGILICPGGGYAMLADYEGHAIAEFFAEHGIHAAVLHYRHGRGHEYPAPLQDAQQSMRVLRDIWRGVVSEDKIAAIGFSAGGHLVSMLSNLPELPVPADVKHVPHHSIRPNATALIYAVIALTGVAKEPGSRRNLLGEDHSEELATSVSTQLHVTPQTPPTFLFHAQNDETVSPDHPIAYVQSLLKHQVSVELHLYPDAGGHGVGLAQGHPRASLWPSLCVSWLRSMGF